MARLGCNIYGAKIALNGTAVSVGPILPTRMYCHRPSGIMDQENRFLKASGRAVALEVDGQILSVRGKEGKVLLVFKATAFRGRSGPSSARTPDRRSPVSRLP